MRFEKRRKFRFFPQDKQTAGDIFNPAVPRGSKFR